MWSVAFDSDGISFTGYPLPAASVFPSGVVRWTDVSTVDPGSAPPEVRLKSGEILFVPATQGDELAHAAAAREIPLEARVDVWDLILEPFLDTEFPAESQERTLRRLESCGITRQETAALRSRFRDPMRSYNVRHWDWVHLGLFDLLEAHVLPFPQRVLPWHRKRFREVYRIGMEIAARAKPRAPESA